MRILVVVDSINIEDSSGSKANVALIKNLQLAGFALRVCHYAQKNIQLDGIDCYAVKERKWNLMYLLSRVERVFTRLTKINLNPYLESWFGFSFTFFNDTKSIVQAVKSQLDFNPDLVLTLSKGGSFRAHYSLLSIPELHDKWIAYVHDPYPFHYYPRPYNWVQPGFRQKERFFQQVSEKAKYSAFPSLLLQEWMASYFPNFQNTGIVIPHQNANYELQNNDFPTYFDVSKFNLLHAGNLMKQRSPKGLLEGFNLFLEQNSNARKDARLLLLGSASYHSELLAKYEGNPEIYIYNGNVPFDEVYSLQKNVSVNIILESKSEISPFLPAKFPHCVEANRSVLLLSPHYSETKRLLGSDYPYRTEVDEVRKIASLIEDLYELWKQNPKNLVLEREDLKKYLSPDYLKSAINKLQANRL